MIGKGSVNHNSRKFNAKNTDPERSGLNIEYCNEPIKQVYHKLFDDALEKYNSRQTRSDRKIENYYEKIRTGKQEKSFHEIIIQIGDMNNMNCLTENGELAKKILEEYFSQFQNRNNNLYVFSAHLHLDESTPHLHIDFVPYTTGSKRGLETRVSLKQALANQGFNGNGKHETEWNQWVLSEKKIVAEIMQKYGIEWEQKGSHEEHLSDYDYKKKMRAEEVKQLEDEIKERSNSVELLKKEFDHLTQYTEQIQMFSNKFDETEEYQLPEPPTMMSAKTYKTKYAEPIIQKLRNLVKEVVVRFFKVRKTLDKLQFDYADLAEENNRLRDNIKHMNDDINYYKRGLSDYALLRKVIGGKKTDEILEQAKNAKKRNRGWSR